MNKYYKKLLLFSIFVSCINIKYTKSKQVIFTNTISLVFAVVLLTLNSNNHKFLILKVNTAFTILKEFKNKNFLVYLNTINLLLNCIYIGCFRII
jgi:hypothetical protein